MKTQALNLPAEICSLQDLRSVVMELRAYAKHASQQEIKQRVHAKSCRSAEPVMLSAAAESLLRDWGRQHKTDSRGVAALISQLEDYLAEAQVVTITLAAPASLGLKKKLVTWCRENISPQVLVSLQFNSALLGGVVIRSGSRIFDWSFRRQILENRQQFPEVLRRV